MPSTSLAQLADTLVWLTVLTYVTAAALLGLELAYRLRRLGRAGLAAAIAGLGLNAAAAAARGLAAGRVPWGNLYEFTVMLALLLAAGYLVWSWRRPEVRPLGAFVLPPAVLCIAAGGLLAYTPAGPLVPALNSGWLRVHVAAAIVGSGSLALASVFSILYLFKDRAERRAGLHPPLVAGGARTADEPAVRQEIDRYLEEEAEAVEVTPPAGYQAGHRPARSRWDRLWDRLPAARVLDELAYRTTAFGFPVWTFAIIAGAIWGQAAWSRYWGWDPKETWSFIVWVVYAGYLHARATSGWRGRSAAWISVVGLAAIAFNLFGVNLWLSGLHSYAT